MQAITGSRLPTADEHDRVIASLDFGFWTSLLSSPYGSPASRAQHWTPPWPNLIPVAFPGYSAIGSSRDRATIAERLDHIRRLRNRISHHEPIWKGRPGSAGAARTPIEDQYQEIIEALGWINGDVRKAAVALSEFPTVFNRGVSPFRSFLARLN